PGVDHHVNVTIPIQCRQMTPTRARSLGATCDWDGHNTHHSIGPDRLGFDRYPNPFLLFTVSLSCKMPFLFPLGPSASQRLSGPHNTPLSFTSPLNSSPQLPR